jgi:hypothetical protein
MILIFYLTKVFVYIVYNRNYFFFFKKEFPYTGIFNAKNNENEKKENSKNLI